MKVENKTKKTVTSALFYVLYIALAVVFLAPLLFLCQERDAARFGYGDAQGVHSLWQPDA